MNLTAGFADPVAGSQVCFRALLDAMARPGGVHSAGAGLQPPAPLGPATAAVLLTLVDETCSLWLGDRLHAARDWLAFHSGARPAELGAAAFACALQMPELTGLDAGSDAGPEDSTTLILQVAALEEGTAYRLAGPGLREPRVLRVRGLPDDFVAQWTANHKLFPRGIDLILCAGDRLCALPRSVQIGEA